MIEDGRVYCHASYMRENVQYVLNSVALMRWLECATRQGHFW